MVLALGLAALGGEWGAYPVAVQCGALGVALLAGAGAAVPAAALTGLAGALHILRG